jgi:hypothetical protein
MKVLVLLLALTATAFADPKLRGELDALAARIAAVAKLDPKDPKTKPTVAKLDADFTAFTTKFERTYKKLFPRQARLKALSAELASATENVDAAPSEEARKYAQSQVAALEAEQAKLEAELAKQTQVEKDREKPYSALYRELTKQRFELLEKKATLLQAQMK